VAKDQRRMPGFDDHVISMYARGMSVREIQGHLLELYGTEVSPDLISTITNEVLEEVTQWQQRPLEPMYPIVYFDALRLKIRDEGTVKNKAVYLALGIRADGRKEVLGLWIEQTEGAKFWHSLHDRLLNLPDELEVFPGHQAGSACGADISGKPSSTIGFEKRWNSLLSLDKDAFMTTLTTTILPRPAKMDRLVAANLGQIRSV
jgi:hypothetical protein